MVGLGHIAADLLQGQTHVSGISVLLCLHGFLLQGGEDLRAGQRGGGRAQPLPGLQVHINGRDADLQSLHIGQALDGGVGGDNADTLQAAAHDLQAGGGAQIVADLLAHFAFPNSLEVVNAGIHVRQRLDVGQLVPGGQVGHGVIHDVAGAHAQALQAVLSDAQRGAGIQLKGHFAVRLGFHQFLELLSGSVHGVGSGHGHVHLQRIGICAVEGRVSAVATLTAADQECRCHDECHDQCDGLFHYSFLLFIMQILFA